jgi:hypothetical protein
MDYPIAAFDVRLGDDSAVDNDGFAILVVYHQGFALNGGYCASALQIGCRHNPLHDVIFQNFRKFLVIEEGFFFFFGKLSKSGVRRSKDRERTFLLEGACQMSFVESDAERIEGTGFLGCADNVVAFACFFAAFLAAFLQLFLARAASALPRDKLTAAPELRTARASKPAIERVRFCITISL